MTTNTATHRVHILNAPAAGDVDKLKRWPIPLLIASCLVLNVCFDWLLTRASDVLGNAEWIVEATVEGMLWGELCFVLLISGFSGRKWLDGFLLAVLLSALGVAALFLGGWLNEALDEEVLVEIGCEGPVYLLAAALPAYFFRHFWGWGFVRGDGPADRLPLSMQDLLGGMAVAAAAISLLRAPMILSEWHGSWYWPYVAREFALVSVVGLLFIPTSAWVGLGDRSRARYALSTLVLVVVGYLTAVGAGQFNHASDAAWSERATEFARCLPLTLGAAAVFLASIKMLSLGGIRLRTRIPVAAKQQDPHQRRRTKLQIATVMSIAIGMSAYLNYLQQWRVQRDQENASLQELVEARGGDLWLDDRNVVELGLHEGTRDGDLSLFRSCSELRSLDLTNARISDAGLSDIVMFSNLTQLGLGFTEITDAGLVHLRPLTHLQSLDLAGTRATGSGLVHVSPTLIKLLASDSHIDDRGCSILPRFNNLEYLFLSNANITDAGTKYIAAMPALYSLDLAHTNVTGAGLSGVEAFHLALDNSKVNDAGIESLADSKSLHTLSLSGTLITSKSVDTIVRIQSIGSLYLSDTAITDDGVKQLARLENLGLLDLSGTQVTGAGFKEWPRGAAFGTLDLGRTKITDKETPHLLRFQVSHTLSFANTDISDESLAHFSKLRTYYLDLSNTRVTASGLLRHDLPGVNELLVATGQFTDDELSQLWSGLTCEVIVQDLTQVE